MAGGTPLSSPQDAERAFYEAFGRLELAAMMAVWDEGEDLVCIHPGGPGLVGRAAVEAGWRRIFAGSGPVQFRIEGLRHLRSDPLCVHLVREVIELEGSTRGVVLATNAYRLTEHGWRMVLHHASRDPRAVDLPKSAPLH
jgi:hypothetical protein